PRAAAIRASVPAPLPTSSTERGAAGNTRTRSSVVSPGPIAASTPDRYGSETMKRPSSGVMRTADAISPPRSRTMPALSSGESSTRGSIGASASAGVPSSTRLVYWLIGGLERHVHLLALQARRLDGRAVLSLLWRSGAARQRRARGSVRRADRRAEVLRASAA